MEENVLKKLYLPSHTSHKGQNGRLLILGGSHLFHSASLWSLEVASRIVDLVHYSSVEENNKIVHKLKEEFRNGIIVPRLEIENYIEEDDCILIGPGMVRAGSSELSNYPIIQLSNLENILKIENEGVQTYFLIKYLLQKYPKKKWVIDAGALQMMDPEDIPINAILTPHHKEFEGLLAKIRNPKSEIRNKFQNSNSKKTKDTSDGVRMHSSEVEESVKRFVKQYNCTVLLKGEKDVVASRDKIEIVKGGNAGMTKGGTGDVLAGLVAALYCKNDAFTSAVSASIINKRAGEDLYKKMGYWFNASNLSDQIPETMKNLLLPKV